MKSERKTEIQCIAFAAMIHDIGKFAERASMSVKDEFRERNKDLYQPKYNGNFSHVHALYTAAFIDKYEQYFPDELRQNKVAGQPVINLAAMHHKPEEPVHRIITEADRIASGLDRSEFSKYNKGIPEAEDSEIRIKEYRKTRLVTLFEGIRGIRELDTDANHPETDNPKQNGFPLPDSYKNYKYLYALKKYSPESIMPVSSYQDKINDEIAQEEYKTLFQNFTDELINLPHLEHLHLWTQHFNQLYSDYAAFIPAATVGNVIPDVSLFDHSRTAAAIAAALYDYHVQTNTLSGIVSLDAASPNEEKFLYIQGDFTGIQNYIFSEGGSTRRKAAKLLRGRSFSVSLLTYLAAMEILDTLELPKESLLMHAAGKFTILAGNTPENIQKAADAERRFNEYLLKRYYGEVSLSVAAVPACTENLMPEVPDMNGKEKHPVKHILQFTAHVAGILEEKKFRKFLPEDFGVFESYLNEFDNTLKQPLCPYCGRRPAMKSSTEAKGCRICEDHIQIGTKLVKSNYLVIHRNPQTGNSGSHRILLDPVFDKYQISLISGSQYRNYSVSDDIVTFSSIRSWDIPKSESGGNGTLPVLARMEINGFVPTLPGSGTEEYNSDKEEFLNRMLASGKSENKQEELWEEISDSAQDGQSEVQPLTFNLISLMSKNETNGGNEKNYQGIEALGVLKADVDHLGLIFQKGIRNNNLSRQAALSRLLNSFFAYYLPYKLHSSDKEKGYQYIYTLFAGGDDLFLIGPYNKIIDFASELHSDFSRFAAENPEITISAGVSVHKPYTPIGLLNEESEEALKLAKSKRDSFSVFGEKVTWKEYQNLLNRESVYKKWIIPANPEKAVLSTSMVYRILNLLEDAKTEKKILRKTEKAGADKSKLKFSKEEIESTKWKSKLLYSMARNIKEETLNDDPEIRKIPEDLKKYSTRLKIPLWKILYGKR